MRSSIIDTIMLSEKRRDIMLLLAGESKSRGEIAESLDMNWNLLKQPVKELKDAGLIFQDDDNYRLSNNGRLMVNALMPLLSMVNTFSYDSDYWVSRDLQAVPRFMAKRMGELENSTLLALSLDYMFEPLKQFIENMEPPAYLHIVLSLFDPEAPALLAELAGKGIEISVVFEQHIYEKMNEGFGEELKKISENKNVSFCQLENEMRPPEIIFTDKEMAIIFFNQNGKYDYRELRSSDAAAIKWGNDLFNCYKDISIFAK
ncbi:helix-turn-helix transcriptional regulator [Methanolobus chelungpuianus]|uniref:Methanogenesis regulatory protein FilR1 middle domain-containing protein n=1 Tax=Methanolobus chelungpuianus TaxID=502115 RepID=A0AAE3HCI3_9EURY|nr:winged helix-turn-helix domain-containing protein [Methanolobus chelungpuianus]MCQ6963796.1 hypothetical protein [Methanolobus chelungpuianus]